MLAPSPLGALILPLRHTTRTSPHVVLEPDDGTGARPGHPDVAP
ncbi:hypothetical protein EV699_104131 [Plasticicumulans lactativorans]|uniref:Uncharacterized protein n=1 Tax=Plasticicumulans lactativorans TaxID=1133106 RepID=A0A4R2LDX1_9GAMM|nr:hypothetical protein EV699_104131 [Plasticicumulans lactativorans]